MSSFRSLLLLAGVAACAFSIGIGAHRIEAAAYSHLGALFTSDREIRDFLGRQYVSDAVAVPLDKNIDTALLPLDVTGVRLSEFFPVPKIGGAIVAINDELLIVDRLGNIYACRRSGEVRKLAFPPLPNGIADYLRAGNTVNSQVFRAYSIKYLSERKLLVVSHELFDTNTRTTRLAVSTIGIDDTSLQPTGQWNTIFSTEPVPPNDASGGRLAVTPSGKIYLSVRVCNIEDRTLAQDPHSSFGKILEIDPESKASHVVSLGHRNPQGLMVSAGGGELCSTEHGPAGGDALNLATEGSNGGWPDVTLGTNYGSYRWNDHGITGRYDGYRPPVFAWVPSIAASNLIEVKGFDQRWDGDLLVSSLKGQSLYRLRLDKDRVVYSEPIWIGQRLRDIAELADGTIALWTDDAEVLFLSKDPQRLAFQCAAAAGARRAAGIVLHVLPPSWAHESRRRGALADQPLLPQDRLGHLSLQCFASQQGWDLDRGYPEAVPVQSERVRERHLHAASKSERRGCGAAGGRAEKSQRDELMRMPGGFFQRITRLTPLQGDVRRDTYGASRAQALGFADARVARRQAASRQIKAWLLVARDRDGLAHGGEIPLAGRNRLSGRIGIDPLAELTLHRVRVRGRARGHAGNGRVLIAGL